MIGPQPVFHHLNVPFEVVGRSLLMFSAALVKCVQNVVGVPVDAS